jgi:hypothetical protein
MRRIPFCVAAALCSAASTPASVVTFVNTGNAFDWVPYTLSPPHAGANLDVTLPATQAGSATPLSIHWNHYQQSVSDLGVVHTLNCSASVLLARSTAVQHILITTSAPQYVDLYPPLDFPAGSSVGPGANWQNTADLGWHLLTEHYTAGEAFTMGLQLSMADGAHYGYARFVLAQSQAYPTLTQYEPTEWGYETSPGVPLVVPAPGAAALLVALPFAVARRRRAIPAG